MFENVKSNVIKVGQKISVRKDQVVKTLIGVGGTIIGIVAVKLISDRVSDDYEDDEEYIEEIDDYEDEEVEECEDSKDEEE